MYLSKEVDDIGLVELVFSFQRADSGLHDGRKEVLIGHVLRSKAELIHLWRERSVLFSTTTRIE